LKKIDFRPAALTARIIKSFSKVNSASNTPFLVDTADLSQTCLASVQSSQTLMQRQSIKGTVTRDF
jgi:hypothetical protein